MSDHNAIPILDPETGERVGTVINPTGDYDENGMRIMAKRWKVGRTAKALGIKPSTLRGWLTKGLGGSTPPHEVDDGVRYPAKVRAWKRRVDGAKGKAKAKREAAREAREAPKREAKALAEEIAARTWTLPNRWRGTVRRLKRKGLEKLRKIAGIWRETDAEEGRSDPKPAHYYAPPGGDK